MVIRGWMRIPVREVLWVFLQKRVKLKIASKRLNRCITIFKTMPPRMMLKYKEMAMRMGGMNGGSESRKDLIRWLIKWC